MTAALLLLALAQAPDAPLAPDEPCVSIVAHGGDIVQPCFEKGRLLTADENLRRGKKTADLQAQLDDLADNAVAIPKPAFIAVIVVGVALLAGSITLGIAYAEKK